MRSTFSGLELARRALESQQTALDTTGHNIANANSKGYTRQVVNLQATIPSSIPSMGHNLTVGTGVTVQGIERARDIFVDRQYRWENTKQSYWSARQNNLNQVEELLNEPDDNSFSNDLDKFWNAWSELSKNPENLGSRSVLLERAATLADTFHHIDQQITEMQKGLDSSVRVQIDQINVAAQQIQELNFQIKRSEVAGDNPNDLRDKRDTLVDELSQLVNVRVVESRDATFKDREVNIFKVYIGDDKTVNNILVDDTTAYQLAEPVMTGADGLPFAEVRWAAGHPYLAGNTVSLGDKMGKLQSDLLLRGSGYDLVGGEDKENAYLSDLRKKYNDLAAGIAETVNSLHAGGIDRAGNTGEVFFDDGVPITAANISINANLINDPWLIATGSVTYGDGEVAQKISSLSSGWTALGGTPPAAISAASFGDFYGSSISELGVDVQQATRMAEGQAVLVNHMFNQRESLSGVSLDEEMTNLVRFQKSYSAAARIVTMLDDMLNTIVNGMGITR
ncbi:flagellar hook-associated protein FlgK [Desulfitobacterium sp. THU1]|uniref:flagellar hook-associated protein FlgK n=1 Tax=Desulfitobacterium sp. THU1 TaxID=3138072 RepID=UPI00311E167D